MRKNRYTIGKCTRWIRATNWTCGRLARYEIYDGAQRLCKQCHQRFMAGKETLFDAGPPQTAAARWALRKRLAEDVPEG